MDYNIPPLLAQSAEGSPEDTVVTARFVLRAEAHNDLHEAAAHLTEALGHVAATAGTTVELATTSLEEYSAQTAQQGALKAYATQLQGNLDDVLAAVTPRQWEVIKGLMEGKSNAQIASDLGIVASTVAVHIQHINELLDTGSRHEIATRVLNPRAFLGLLNTLDVSHRHQTLDSE